MKNLQLTQWFQKSPMRKISFDCSRCSPLVRSVTASVACRGGGAYGATAPGIQGGGIQRMKLQE